MRQTVFWAAIMLGAGACLAGDPVVSNVRAQQRGGGSRLVDIRYDAADSDGDRLAVSVTLTDNGAPVPAASVTGDVGAGVRPGPGKQIVWDAGADWSGHLSENVRATVTADDGRTGSGQYLVIDLSGGTGASSYPVTYLTAVPSGGWSDTYKTTRLVMRKIPKGTFTMGSPSGELGRSTVETQHQVTLTKDFYIGVFEVTQRQWELVMGNRPSYFNNATHYATRPVEQVSYFDIRENPANSAISPNWPASSQVHADSFMGKLRAKTGLSTFDLPTESQWEYACRAGTGTALNSGKNLTGTGSCPNMSEVGRYWYNGGSSYSQGCAPSAGTAMAGSYLPNAWGLHDMHGNVREWCLDGYGTYPGTATDPLGAASGSNRVIRGGGWGTGDAGYCRSAYRYRIHPDSRYNYVGFRGARTLP